MNCYTSIWDKDYSTAELVGIYIVAVVLCLSIIIFICACVIDCLEKQGIRV